MGYVKVAVSFDGMQCTGCERESVLNIMSTIGDYCELFEVSKPPGLRCEACIANEIDPEELCE